LHCKTKKYILSSGLDVLAMFKEKEGMTLVILEKEAQKRGLNIGLR